MITRERVEGRIGIGLTDLERSRSQRVQLKLDMDVVSERFVFTRVARIKQLEVI